MYVSEYKVENRQKGAAFKYKTGLEKNKLFVKQVHYDATKEQLEVSVPLTILIDL